jgi:hypothetical protein
MLSAYRELKKDSQEAVALDLHVASCAECRQLLAQHHRVGEQIRSLPAVEPSPQAYSRLMQALAVEHTRFIQRSPSSAALTPTPDFLKPYLKGHVSRDPQTDALTAFSRADTGPLPVIRPVPKRAPAFHLNHFAIVGLAAAFLLVLMTGGITSVLLLAQSRQAVSLPQGAGKNTTSLQQVSQVTMVSAATSTTYPHVVSAVADRQYIYYTAYGENTSDWMLERLDTQQQISTPLLPTASASPLIILGGSQGWLAWLQFDQPQPVKKTKAHTNGTASTRTWKLYSLSLTTENTDPSNTLSAPATPEVLLQGTFDQKTVPSWVHTPVQGVWFTQDSLLVTSIDQKGVSHLTQYPLKTQTTVTGSNKNAQTQTVKTTQELANAHDGHILTSPTANNDGSSIYWSEEWLSLDNTLHSNVWTQQTVTAAPQPGKWVEHSAIQTFQFTEDDSSFRPQVVNNTLFLLQAAKTDVTNQLQVTPTAAVTPTVAATTTPEAATTVAPTAPATPVAENGILARVDPGIYSAPLDASIQGALQAYSPETGAKLSLALGADGPISALQAGGRFLIWQNSNNSFDMFDVAANIPVNVNPTIVPKDAVFLAVNGDSAVWLASSDMKVDSNDITNSTVKFGTFNWPPPKTTTSTRN